MILNLAPLYLNSYIAGNFIRQMREEEEVIIQGSWAVKSTVKQSWCQCRITHGSTANVRLGFFVQIYSRAIFKARACLP